MFVYGSLWCPSLPANLGAWGLASHNLSHLWRTHKDACCCSDALQVGGVVQGRQGSSIFYLALDLGAHQQGSGDVLAVHHTVPACLHLAQQAAHLSCFKGRRCVGTYCRTEWGCSMAVAAAVSVMVGLLPQWAGGACGIITASIS